MRPGVFLDRDDTLLDTSASTAASAHPGDLVDPGAVRLLAGAGEACARLRAAGYALVVVTNQGGVARGHAGLEGVERVHDAARALLRGGGGEPDAFYYCPFHADAPAGRWGRDHPWRKPGPGMVLAAMDELALDPARSWLVGDSARDVAAGVAAGLAPDRCLRIGAGTALPDLGAAAARILSGDGS